MATIFVVDLWFILFAAITSLCSAAGAWLSTRRAKHTHRSLLLRACLAGMTCGGALFAAFFVWRCDHWGRAVAGGPIAFAGGAFAGLLPGIIVGFPVAYVWGEPQRSDSERVRSKPIQLSLSTLILCVASVSVVLATIKLCWPTWQPVAVATVGTIGGVLVQRTRRRNIMVGGFIGLVVLLFLYPLSFGPAAVLVWDGYISPYSWMVVDFYHPVMNLGAQEPFRETYEWYMCHWLDIDAYSLWYWTDRELGLRA